MMGLQAEHCCFCPSKEQSFRQCIVCKVNHPDAAKEEVGVKISSTQQRVTVSLDQ